MSRFMTVSALSPTQDKLESVLDVSHQQMEQYRDQPAHAEKIAYQQRLLQEDVVHIRAEISQVSTVMTDFLLGCAERHTSKMTYKLTSQDARRCELVDSLFLMHDTVTQLSIKLSL